jgi:hypothetical protein
MEIEEPTTMKFRNWVKSSPAGALAWRLAVGFLGGLITFFGIIFLVTPGPGIPILVIGLGILASEFAWAKRAVEKAKESAKGASEKAPFLKLKWVIPISLVSALLVVGYWIYILTD